MIPLRYKAFSYALQYDVFVGLYDPARRALRGRRSPPKGDSLLIHIPKSAGISLFDALGETNAGHRLFCDIPARHKRAAQRIVFCTRDPFDRLRSSYNYLRRIGESRSAWRRLGVVAVPATFEQFVMSDELAQLASHHYFFRSQFRYLQGIEAFADKLVHLRFETLAADAAAKLGIELRRLNAAPSTADGNEHEEERLRQHVRSVYRDDYSALPALLGECGIEVAWPG